MAVVGKVGTYAQVQPIEGPNFGGMVQAQFDKLDAERKAKANAEEKARAKKQEELDKLTLPSVKTSNIAIVNKQLEEKYHRMYEEFGKKRDAGDLNGARQLIASVGTLNNAVQFFNDKYKELTSSEGKYNSHFLTQFEDLLRNANDANTDVEYLGDGLDVVTIYKDPEKKEVLVKGNPNEILNSINVPFKFDGDMLNKSVGSFVKTFKPDKIETIINKDTFYGTKSIEDALNDPEINDELRRQAKNMVADRNTRAFYAQESGMSLFQIDNFDETQKKEAEDYFYKIYKDALKNEIDYSISKKSKGGGGGGKEEFDFNSPVVFESPYINLGDSTSKPTAEQIKKGVGSNSQFIFTSEEYKKNPVRSITVGKGNTALNVSNMPLDQIVYDPIRKKIFLGISRPVRSSSSVRGNQVSGGVGDSEKETVWLDAKDPKFASFKANASRVLNTKIETEADVIKYFFLNNL